MPGYIIIPQDFDFTMIPDGFENAVWELKYEYDIQQKDIQLPDGVTLYFLAGKFMNYNTIRLNNTKVIATNKVFDLQGEILGNFAEPIDIVWLGAKSDAVELSDINCVAGSSIITSNSDSFSISDIGKKIQLYGAGHNNSSFQGTIISFNSPKSITIENQNIDISPEITPKNDKTTPSTTKNNIPAVMGTDSQMIIEKAIEYTNQSNLSYLHIKGNLLMAGIDGDLVVRLKNSNFEGGYNLNLKYSNITYDFNNSIIYGAILVQDYDGFPQINNVTVKNASIYCLGDTLDASTGNTNWNAAGIVEGNNCIFQNIIVRCNGGIRAFSFQNNLLNGGLHNCTLSNFYVYGIIDGEKSDGLDVSSTGDLGITNIQCSNLVFDNLASAVIVRNVVSGNFLKNINVSNIKATNISKIILRYSNILNSSITDIRGECINYSRATNDHRPIVLQNCSEIDITNCIVINERNNLDYLCLISGGSKNKISNIRLTNKNSSNPTTNAIYLGSENLVVKDIYIDGVNIGLYKLGVPSLIDGYIHINTVEPIRNNPADIKTMVRNVYKLNDDASPIDDGRKAKAFVSFNGTLSGAIPIIRQTNVSKVDKVSEGVYRIEFTTPLSEPPIISGNGRKYQLDGRIISLDAMPSNNAVIVRAEKRDGILSDSDLIQVVFF
ncbi:hypothetical protein NBT05_02370 [Aquimarina sp. ERC-38]|uniref:hypothetical protein n=1 Tax=Aquimarina sp. ERC-38 TaxID=2949996 RepID=UPI002246F301|nr:hypothetical protein [Aquimarina sp. ERC-38]UZO81329.1 hypothetical protein NBT05_02370 [Aquimarina sp. ERC-38]